MRFLQLIPSSAAVRLALCVVAMLLPAPAVAQEPAAEPAGDAPDLWKAQLEFGFNGARGNSELIALTSAFQIERLEQDLFTLEWRVGYRYGESEGEVIARNAQSSLSFDVYPNERWSPFIYLAAERDPFKRLDLRTDGGAGAKYTITRGEGAEASVSAALLHRYENFSARDSLPAAPTLNSARWSIRAKASRQMREGWQVENVSFFKPVYNRLGDYDIDSVTRLNAMLNTRLALTFSYLYRVDSTPPSGVAREDQVLTAGLTVNF